MAELSPELIVAIITGGTSLIGVTILFIKSRVSENKKYEFHRVHEEANRYHSQLNKINKYREPLIQACLDLYHYLEAVFYRDRNGLETERDKMEMLYSFAQLFGWMEIVRKELLEFNFDDAELNIKIRTAFGDVYTAFEDANYVSDNSFHQTYMEQRALGELMLDEKHSCLDYTTFVTHMIDPGFRNWFKPLLNSLTALELSIGQFDPSTYYKIQHGELHAWSEDYKELGMCETCGGNKSNAHHRTDVTAHFYRLYRVYLAVIALVKILDFEKKRVKLKNLVKEPTGFLDRLKAWYSPRIVHDDSSIIVDRMRHDFMDRIVHTHRNASNSGSRTSLTHRPVSIKGSGQIIIERIDLTLKLRDKGQIIDERIIQIQTNITVSDLHLRIAKDLESLLKELKWDPQQLVLSSLVTKLDIDISLAQYGLRNGSIIYVTRQPLNDEAQYTTPDSPVGGGKNSYGEYKVDISESDNMAGIVDEALGIKD